jgi:ribosomal protein S18 acetylase RimI-like enzyme
MENENAEKGGNCFGGITIGYANGRELYPIFILSKEHFPYANFTTAEIQRRIESGRVIYLVARMGDRMAGYLDYELYDDHAKILGLAVLPEFRKKGVATALVRRALEDLQKRNYHRAYLFVAKNNPLAQKIYGREGFKNAGILERKINDEEVCLFQKDF